MHARQVLYHWPLSPAPKNLFLSQINLTLTESINNGLFHFLLTENSFTNGPELSRDIAVSWQFLENTQHLAIDSSK